MDAKPASSERLARYRRGRFSELVAAALLMAKGYRILAPPLRTPYGEIDSIAVRGRRLAFVEVKRRATRLEAEAALIAASGRPHRASRRILGQPQQRATATTSGASMPCSWCPAGCRCTSPTRSTWHRQPAAFCVDTASRNRLAWPSVSALNRGVA